MNKKFLNKKYNLTYLGMYLFLSTSIGLGTMNVYELVKDEKQIIINSEDNTTPNTSIVIPHSIPDTLNSILQITAAIVKNT